MARTAWVWKSARALACLCLAACAGGDDGSDSSKYGIGGCIPNTTVECSCPDGTTGIRTCGQEGLIYGQCMCGAMNGSPAGGSAGMGGGMAGGAPVGSAGTGAQVGMGPMAGTMASPMSGTAGMAPSGMAGMDAGGSGMGAGTAGMSGAAGMMAMAGMGGMGGSVASGDEVPDNVHCQPVADWDPAWSAFEEEVLVLVNQNRAMGWNCDTQGQFAAAGPLTMNPYLRCAARLHSKDMNDRAYFAHDNPDGDGPGERMDAAGYMGGTWGENIAMGQQTPAQVVQGWMDSDGHCANIMRPQFTEIGVGFYQGASRRNLYWTQNFGAPCSGRWCM